MANSSYTFLLRQKPAIIDSVVKTFHLSQMEKEYLLTAVQGRGILILDNEHQELEVVASPKEHRIITTNPNEIVVEKVEEVEEIKVDVDKKLYYGNNLKQDEKNILANAGYRVCNFVPIGKQRQEEIWLKENEIESLQHTFLVENIKEEILKYTKDVQIYLTQKPDLVFKNKNGKEVAIEVETGIGFGKHKKRLIEKFAMLRYEYKDNIAIILTDRDYRKRYEAIAPMIKTMVRGEVGEYLKEQLDTNGHKNRVRKNKSSSRK